MVMTTRLAGLASGIDTESMINDMMKVKRIPLDKLQQAKTINSWKTDAYREINTKIASFRDAMAGLRLQGTFNAQKATSGDTRIDVSMAGTSTQADFSISEAKLAIPAKTGSLSFDTKISSGSTLIDPSKTETITFNLNGTDITIPNTSTFDEMIAKINSAQTNVKAANVGGSLVFTTTETGVEKSITITGSSAASQNLLQIVDGTTSIANGFPTATGASYSDGAAAVSGYAVINGTKINVSTNTFTYEGVQINLKQDIPVDSAAVVSIAPDTDKIFDKIKTFVDKYNDLIKDLNAKLSEPKKRDYPP
ncbi:MAG: flagellar filament capping protein FliD, partial [Bacillus sp. (in: Bacteria)]|nr:flagellar filament capping protein FliD [Bacillus sp. (in: firmicutes)]